MSSAVLLVALTILSGDTQQPHPSVSSCVDRCPRCCFSIDYEVVQYKVRKPVVKIVDRTVVRKVPQLICVSVNQTVPVSVTVPEYRAKNCPARHPMTIPTSRFISVSVGGEKVDYSCRRQCGCVRCRMSKQPFTESLRVRVDELVEAEKCYADHAGEVNDSTTATTAVTCGTKCELKDGQVRVSTPITIIEWHEETVTVRIPKPVYRLAGNKCCQVSAANGQPSMSATP
jgi:hypothetical protein